MNRPVHFIIPGVVFYLALLLTQVCAQSQNRTLSPHVIAIDHVPVVVSDLDEIKKVLSETLHFKVKAGRPHEGIENCFVKFQDTTYLEFTMPLDSTPSIGKFYTHFLKKRQGGTALAISVQSAEAVELALQEKGIPFTSDSNQIWKTIDPPMDGVFYIEYDNKTWKDTKENTTHPNGTVAFQSVWVLSSDLTADIRKYTGLGFTYTGKGKFMGISGHQLEAGKSQLFLLDARAGKPLAAKFSARNVTGICGFTLKVSSLALCKSFFLESDHVLIDQQRILYFLKPYNIFFEFVE